MIRPEDFQRVIDKAESREYPGVPCITYDWAWENRVEIFEALRRAANADYVLVPREQTVAIPFDERSLINKCVSMWRMIDTEQMWRTIKAMREMNMSLWETSAAQPETRTIKLDK